MLQLEPYQYGTVAVHSLLFRHEEEIRVLRLPSLQTNAIAIRRQNSSRTPAPEASFQGHLCPEHVTPNVTTHAWPEEAAVTPRDT
eukprot:167133-Rhodomonas_salina.1